MLDTFASADSDKTFFVNLMEAYAVHKAETEKSIKESEKKFPNVEGRLQEPGSSRDTLDAFTIKVK